VVRVFETEVALEHRSLKSSVEIPSDLSVPMDEDMLVRALENLLKNAISYSTAGSDICFRCFLEDRYVAIEIENEGPGIRPEDLPHVFDPFVRGARDRKGAGLGLGLATVESVISSHGWTIDAESEPGKTTVFRITIPRFTGAVESS
jgi:two-component system OmpR family sensor kinase